MWDAPDTAAARFQQREATKRRRRDSDREDLIAAAREMIPEFGMGVTLSRIAVRAGLPRHIGTALFNATSDIGTELVRRAWRALIEQLVPAAGTAPVDFIATLIDAIRIDADAHRIHHALSCGAPRWQRETLEAADALLALAVGEALRVVIPAILPGQSARLGRLVFDLARAAAFAPEENTARAEAAVIATVLAALVPPPVADQLPAPPAADPPEPALVGAARLAPQPTPAAPARGAGLRGNQPVPLQPGAPLSPLASSRGQDPPARAA